MKFAQSFISKFKPLVLSYLSVGVIGIMDYNTTSDFSFSIFYIIPIALFALQRRATLRSIVLLCVLSTIFWFISDYSNRSYPHFLFPIWNSLVRLCIFLLIGITLRKYSEGTREQEELNGRLQQLNEEKNRFIGIAAHDLRSPMGMIINLTGLLKNDPQLAEKHSIQDLFAALHQISQNNLNLINNLLDIAKIESGKIELHRVECDYIAFMKEQLEYNQLVAGNKEITIAFTSNVASVHTSFDRSYLTQVINNLISNAVKFSNRGSAIHVNVLANPAQIRTEVIDFGRGIKQEEQRLLFNYFQKTSTTSTEGERSTGLGLAIVKKVIQSHQGNIGVSSQPNQGSTFYFTLPILP